jgi:hypothetical protein
MRKTPTYDGFKTSLSLSEHEIGKIGESGKLHLYRKADVRFSTIAILMVLISHHLGAAQDTNAVKLESKVRLLITGHEDIAPPLFGSDEVWYALQYERGQWSLRLVKPSAIAETPMVGLEGTRISAEAVDDGSFLIGRVPNLREGPITSSISDRQVLYPGQTVFVQEFVYLLEAEGTAIGGEYGGMVFLDYAFWLRGNQRRELVVMKSRMSSENPPSVEWAGDLDRDGVPDFILNMPHGDVGSNYILFLSSLATDGHMVSPVAIYTRLGC